MKKILFILLILISSFTLITKVDAIKCSYNVSSSCRAIVSQSGSNSISTAVEGSGLKCTTFYVSFNLNVNKFFSNGTFQCAPLYKHTFVTQAHDGGTMFSTTDRYTHSHGDANMPIQAEIIEDEPVGGDGDDFMPGHENDKYAGIETCTDVDVNYIKACGCIPAEVADITSKVYFILRLLGPIILLIIGSFDMAKAVVTQDEKSIAKAQKKLVNKFVAAAAIFLVLTIIKFAVGIVADDVSGIFKCIDILLDGYVI